MSSDKYTIGIAQPAPPTICIKANDGRALLTIKPDGTVTGEIEDASEAARVFVEHIRGMIAQPTQSDALREALERIKAATCNEIRAGDKGYVSRYGIHGIASAALQEQSK